MIDIIDQRKGKPEPVSISEFKVNVTIISNSVIKVNNKYVIRTYKDDWMRQDATWQTQEISAAKQITEQLNANRK